ncbi:MAG: hypothetical protein IJZ34_04995 [Lachnospiraceae bacterium]|nr:hypothetical protein [Lachnospiraceae bacterium]
MNKKAVILDITRIAFFMKGNPPFSVKYINGVEIHFLLNLPSLNKNLFAWNTDHITYKINGGNYIMAKAGMKRPDPKEPHGTESNHKTHFPKNEVPPVPEIQGKAKSGHKKAKPM